MLSESDEDHFKPSVRLIEFEKNGPNCGFNLTRGKWDPYPWVSSVDEASVAFQVGIKSGDCVIEVNGKDVIGKRISEIAEIVKSKPGQVSLLVWNAGVDPQCTPEALCCGPIPSNLQRLSACMSTILAFLECPVCLDTIPPPTYQCDNGHLICIRCRTKSERCPVCRLRFSRGRSLISDQIYNSLIEAFNLREENDESRATKIQQIFKSKNKNKNIPDIKITHSHTNKFLAKIIGRASSVDNLSSNSKFLSPNNSQSDNEFNTNLKTKSLSSNELFQSDSSQISRSGSMSRINRKESNVSNCLTISINSDNRPASYHGSYESLERKIKDVNHPVHNSLNFLDRDSQDNGLSFYCPFAAYCTVLVKAHNLIEHFKSCHKEPLVQYFTPNVQTQLNKLIQDEELCFMINTERRNIFFIRTMSSRDEINSLEDILIWVWYMGDKTTSKDYEFQIEIKNKYIDSPLLRVRSSVFSLSSISSKEIKDFEKGVFLSSQTLNALGPLADLLLDITILKNDS